MRPPSSIRLLSSASSDNSASTREGIGKGAASRHNRVETERFQSFAYEEPIKRDKVNLDIFWLKDDAQEESVNLPPPEIIAQKITDDLKAAQEQFAAIVEGLK